MVNKDFSICYSKILIILFLVPPEQLSILDEDGSHIPHYVLGPYDEGDNINVTCVATGGTH